MFQRAALIHYHEIGLKGRNRAVFERRLSDNVAAALSDLDGVKVERFASRLLVRTQRPADIDMVVDVVRHIPGVASVAPTFLTDRDISQIMSAASLAAHEAQERIQKTTSGTSPTFAVESRRSSTNFEMSSMEMNRVIGQHLVDELGLSVNLGSPDITVRVEVVQGDAYVSSAKIPGPGGLPVLGAVTYLGNTATFTPNASLVANTTYTATVTTGVKDLAGNTMAANKVWTFTTGAAVDTTAPVVTSSNPSNQGASVITTSLNTATFSEQMNPLTLTTATFTLTSPGAVPVPVQGTVSYSGNTATFTPTTELVRNTLYTATITTGAQDLAGNPLEVDKVWTFTTALGPAPVNLRTAADFAVLAKTGISTVPGLPTFLRGNGRIQHLCEITHGDWPDLCGQSDTANADQNDDGDWGSGYGLYGRGRKGDP
ncbi:MAG: hypothetical protein CVV27_21630 [Candidatus Melainabacteria bacterium HGW-Melainabacteria-1]|nr:MAG: hypothetical protein CVV27_21630 [Candidatus Melainabacteria bacterium HGW-Melainabacteria-1]